MPAPIKDVKAWVKKRTTVDEHGCWIWGGATFDFGHAKVFWGGKHLKGHRIAYEAFVGPIPDGLVVRHTCDVPGCLNPDHLVIGTQADNRRDCVERGRHATGSQVHTSKLTEDQRELIAWSTAPTAELARRYGVHASTVRRVKRRAHTATATAHQEAAQ